MPFALRRLPIEPRRRRLRVRAVEELTPHYRRVVFESAELEGFASPGADDHVRMFFPASGGRLPVDPDPAALVSREFTPAAVGADSLSFEFVLHGTGPASEWAAAAEPGDEVLIGGPRAAMLIEGEPDWWLLAGDLTALPAIRRFLASVPEGAPVEVILLAEDGESPIVFGDRPGLRVRIVDSLDALLAAAETAELPDGEGFAFIAAEQAVVAPGRHLLTARGIDLEHAIVKGYWRRGLSADAPK